MSRCEPVFRGFMAGCLSSCLLLGCSQRVRCACWSAQRRHTRCRTSLPTMWRTVRLFCHRTWSEDICQHLQPPLPSRHLMPAALLTRSGGKSRLQLDV